MDTKEKDKNRKREERAALKSEGLVSLRLERWVKPEHKEPLHVALSSAFEKELKRLAKLAGQSGA